MASLFIVLWINTFCNLLHCVYIYGTMKIRGTLLFLLLLTGTVLNGQYTKEFKRIFFDADYLMETGFYEEAFNRYKNLLTLDPGNYNLLFRCGACCLNIPGNEAQAVTYLKEAVEGVSPGYKEKSHKESSAPVLTYFMLGRAYHLNYQFDEAVDWYTTYLDRGSNQDQTQLEYASLQIEACKRADRIERTRPLFAFHGVLIHFDGDLPSCSHPVISGKSDLLVFLADYPSDKKVMMSTRTGGLWSRPRVINNELGMVGETYPVSLSYDGKDLYLVHQYYSHSDIFVSHFQNGRWTEAEDLGYKINGRTSENHACVSKDGKSLYFTSDTRGGTGSFDIYVSRIDEKGEWGEPENLGPAINTPYEDLTPFISGNDSILFFSSQGHESMGGADVFYSRLQSDGSWSKPENLGYPVNTPGDDVFYNPGWDEMEGYYAVRREDDPTSNTINTVTEIAYGDELAQTTVPDPGETDSEESDSGETDSREADSREADSRETVKTVETEQTTGTYTVSENQTYGYASEEFTREEFTVEQVNEPPNTDEVEMVLNNRSPVTEKTEPATPVSTAIPVSTATPVSAASPAFTDELTTIIPFELNRYELNLAAQLEVEKVAELMSYYPDANVEIIGHADATGKDDYNMMLSNNRAEIVADYLIIRGIDQGRIRMEGRGESDPLAINSFSNGSDAPLGRYLNRQVYVKLTGILPRENVLAGVYVPVNLVHNEESSSAADRELYYFVQIMATRKPTLLSRFAELEDVKEFTCKDGFYRYTTGSFRTIREARMHVLEVRKMGYERAFIQTREWYDRAIQ